MSIYCAKHIQERKDNFAAAKADNPDLTELEWVATQPIFNREKFEACPDCKYVGLNKSGVIGELDSPKDWLFSREEVG